MRDTSLAPEDETRKQLTLAIVAWIRGDDLGRLCWRTGLSEDAARRAIRCFFAGALDGLAGFAAGHAPRPERPAAVLPLHAGTRPSAGR